MTRELKQFNHKNIESYINNILLTIDALELELYHLPDYKDCDRVFGEGTTAFKKALINLHKEWASVRAITEKK